MGLQLADYLSQQGKRVHLAEQSAAFGAKMTFMDLPLLEERLAVGGVTKYSGVERIEIRATDDVWVVNASGEENLPGIESIVFARDRRPNIALVEVAEARGIEYHVIGDASGVSLADQGTVWAAIAAGYDIGRQL